jgi:hypothetical protein
MQYKELLCMDRKALGHNFPIIGQGSGRIVFDAGDVVIKYAKNDKGLIQNSNEHDIYNNAGYLHDILCPVLDSSRNDKVLIMAKAIPFSKMSSLNSEEKHIIKKLKSSFAVMRKRYICWSGKSENKFRDNTPWVNEINALIQSLIDDFDVLPLDCFRASSWAHYNGKCILVDYGLSQQEYDRLYHTKRIA